MGVATGGEGISVYTPPISLPSIFWCGCSVSLQGLVNIYTHPNQIPGYASVCGIIACPFRDYKAPLGTSVSRVGTATFKTAV